MAGADPDPASAPAKWCLDPVSRLHLRIFRVHMAIIGLFALPMLTAPLDAKFLFAHLGTMFALSALSLSLLALVGRHGALGRSLGLWDEVLALWGLSLGCTILARLAN